MAISILSKEAVTAFHISQVTSPQQGSLGRLTVPGLGMQRVGGPEAKKPGLNTSLRRGVSGSKPGEQVR